MNYTHIKGKHIARKKGTLTNLFAGITAAGFLAVTAFTSWALLEQLDLVPQAVPTEQPEMQQLSLSSLSISESALPPEGGPVLWQSRDDAAGLSADASVISDESPKPLSANPTSVSEKTQSAEPSEGEKPKQEAQALEKATQSVSVTHKVELPVFAEVPSAEKQGEKREYLGKFIATAYCPCAICCGKGAKGITYTGTKATQGRTVAVDPKVIPLGSVIYINGKAYTAEDIGSGIEGKRLDIFYNSHQDALNWGEKTVEVWIQK